MKFKETDLYDPVKDFFTRLGYEVKSEARGCDVTAVKDGELIIIELKLTFNVRLLHQAMERQKITRQVYAAVPRPKRASPKEYKYNLEIAKRMGIGLIFVALDSPVRHVDIAVFPEADGKLTPSGMRKRAKLNEELEARTGDYNTGGSSKKKINTAFRERAVYIACVLERTGPLRASILVREYGCAQNAYGIMYNNFYGWFERAEGGGFTLTEKGREYLFANGGNDLVTYYREALKDRLLGKNASETGLRYN